MANLLELLATQTGIPPETVEKAVGGVLAFLKEHGFGSLDSLKGVLPDADAHVAAYEAGKDEAGAGPGGLIASLTGLAGKVFGGSVAEGGKLVQNLSLAGLDTAQITAFLPKLIEHLRSFLPPELMDKLTSLLGGFLESSQTPAASE